MRMQSYHLELITPCFCAGADQACAEIRASAIRGALRWWIRAMGASAAQEASVFGAVSGNSGISSSVQIRIADLKPGPPWDPPQLNPNALDAYVYFFASVSGRTKGERWTSKGNIPPRTTFRLDVRQLRSLAPELQEKFEACLDMFLSLGSIGLRVTRGLGAFVCEERPLSDTTLETLETRLRSAGFGFQIYRRDLGTDWKDAIKEVGKTLKEGLRQGLHMSAKSPSPLGFSEGRQRQTSAVYLRPVRRDNNCYSLILFEAPAVRVLGHPSRNGAPVLPIQ